jgi:hypothetical protein
VARAKNIRRQRAQEAEKLLIAVAKENNISVKTLRSDCRFPHIVQVRREFCLRAHAAGIGGTTIANALWKHFDTVRYHILPRVRDRRRHRAAEARQTTHANLHGEHR